MVRLLGLVLVAVAACSALVAASASAEVVFLLAEWLWNGKPVGEGEQLEVVSTGELLLADIKTLLGESSVLCSGRLEGWVGFDGLDMISDVLNLEGTAQIPLALEGTGLVCVEEKNCASPKVWADNLPWETLAELMEDPVGTEFWVILILGEPGWHVICEGTFGKPEDLCVAKEGAIVQLGLSLSTLNAKFSEAFTELAGFLLATCTLGGVESGVVESDEPLGTIEHVGGGTLSVSSEDPGGEFLEP